jgi:hypothetical protein
MIVFIYAIFLVVTRTVLCKNETSEGTTPSGINAPLGDSEMLLLSKALSLKPDAGYGAFARFPIIENALVCEFNGLTIHEKDMSFFNQQIESQKGNNSVLDFIALEVDGMKYNVVGDSMCMTINDCTNSTDPAVRQAVNDTGCYNAKYIYYRNKLFIKTIRPIATGEELYVDYGVGYWNTLNGRSAVRIDSLNPEQLRSNHGIEVFSNPDSLVLYTAKSTILGESNRVGNGVFARVDIKKGTMLAEYRGTVYFDEADVISDKWSAALSHEGYRNLKVDGNTIASMVNDAAWIYDNPYFNRQTVLSTIYGPQNYAIIEYPGCKRNTAQMTTFMKSWLVATEDIKKDSELFLNYGVSYWRNQLLKEYLGEGDFILVKHLDGVIEQTKTVSTTMNKVIQTAANVAYVNELESKVKELEETVERLEQTMSKIVETS